MDQKEIVINLSLAAVSIVLVFAGLELALVIADVGQPVGQTDEETIVCWGEGEGRYFHPDYGWTETPDTRFLTKDTSNQPWTQYTYNNEGFRDTYETDTDDHIIVLGDSFTHGSLASDNATYPHLLDRWTPSHNIKNYGIPGYGTENSLAVYRDVGSQLDHDTVIYTHYSGNDMLNNVDENSMRPQFEETESGVELVDKPTNTEGGADQNKVIQNDRARQLINFLDENTRTYTFIEPRLRNLLVKINLADPVVTELPDDNELDQQTTLTRGLIKKLAAEAESNDAELVIINIPERGEVRPERPQRFSPNDAKKYGNLQREMFEDIADSNENVTFRPMKPVLINEVDNGNRVYGLYDGHLDDSGYRVTAMTVYDHLVEYDHIKDTNPDFAENYTMETGRC